MSPLHIDRKCQLSAYLSAYLPVIQLPVGPPFRQRVSYLSSAYLPVTHLPVKLPFRQRVSYLPRYPVATCLPAFPPLSPFPFPDLPVNWTYVSVTSEN